MTTDEIVAKRIAKYTADIGHHTAPSQPDRTCRCGACMQIRSIIGELEYIQMAARNLAPRCPVCDWPMAESRESGCVPDDCSYRPEQGSPEWHRIQKRRAAISAGNQTQDKREC